MFNHLLLCTHGSNGALKAEKFVFEALWKGRPDVALTVLTVINADWQWMTGDDWLNNGSTRNRFRDYLETELEDEVRAHMTRLQEEAAAREITYSAEVMVGKPEACLIAASQKTRYDMVVMGSPRPKGKQGLRCRMSTEPLLRSLTSPLLIVPYPDA